MTKNQKNRETIAKGLAKTFKAEPEKIAYWLMARNPNFGNISPSELIVLLGDKGIEKVARFVELAVEENLPSEKGRGE